MDQEPEGIIGLPRTISSSVSADHGEATVAVGIVAGGGQDVGDSHQVIQKDYEEEAYKNTNFGEWRFFTLMLETLRFEWKSREGNLGGPLTSHFVGYLASGTF